MAAADIRMGNVGLWGLGLDFFIGASNVMAYDIRRKNNG
jgi:hypothetical protein